MYEKAVNQIESNMTLYDLSKFKDPLSVLNLMESDSAGVYAWYPKIELDFSCTQALENDLIIQVESPHIAKRRTKLPPNLGLMLYSDNKISQAKKKQMSVHIKEKRFLDTLSTIIKYQFLFQNPLYVGKAENIVFRIRQHLKPASKLRTRFSDASIVIDRCRLLVLELPSESKIKKIHDDNQQQGEEVSNIPSEQMFEELISRLFHPWFTLRYG